MCQTLQTGAISNPSLCKPHLSQGERATASPGSRAGTQGGGGYSCKASLLLAAVGLDPPAAAAAPLDPKLVPQVGYTELEKGLLLAFILHLVLSDVLLYQLPLTCCLVENHVLYSHLLFFEATDERNCHFL